MQLHTVRTPAGNEAKFWCREQTNDRMTVEGDVEQDRYHLVKLPRKGGLHIDIGSHIGTWVVSALIDDPQATAIAVEPLSENVEMIWYNAKRNDVGDRLEVIQAAFAKRGPIRIAHGFRSAQDPEQAAMHRHIGGFDLSLLPEDTRYEVEEVPAITPRKLLTKDVACLKVAGETSEQALVGADLSRVELLIGKYHSKLPKLIPHLEKTHDVETYPDVATHRDFDTFGWYVARQRG